MTTPSLASEREPLILSSSDSAEPASCLASLTRTRESELPPGGYAIAVLSDGLFLPLCLLPAPPTSVPASLSEDEGAYSLSLRKLSWYSDLIPQAFGNLLSSDPASGCTYDEALWWCQRHAETVSLLSEMQGAAVCSECYPERNIWYREEIEHLLRANGYDWSDEPDENGPFCFVATQQTLLAWLDIHIGSKNNPAGAPSPRSLPGLNLHVEAINLDELWMCLYEAVSTILAESSAKECIG